MDTVIMLTPFSLFKNKNERHAVIIRYYHIIATKILLEPVTKDCRSAISLRIIETKDTRKQKINN
jgi:hypothetical protein